MNEVSLTVRSTLNFAASVVIYVLRIAIGIFLNPVMLRGVGSDGFGLWQICQRLLTYVASAEGRASQALKWRVAFHQQSEDVEGKIRDIGAALVVWLVFLPLVLVVGIAVAWFSPLLVSDLDPRWTTVVRVTCVILVVRLALTGVAQIPESVLQGANLGYRTAWIRSGAELAGGALTYLAIRLGWGLPGMAVALLVTVLISGALHLSLARRLVPWLGAKKPTRKQVRGFLGFSIWLFLWTLVNKILLFGDVVILGLVAGAETVAVYTLTFYAAQTGMHTMAMLVSGAVPGIGGIIGAGQHERAIRLRSELWALVWLCLTVVGAVVLAWNRSFVTLWVGAPFYAGALNNMLLYLMVVQLVLLRLDAFIIDVTLNLKDKVCLGAVAAVLTVAGAVWGANRLAITGMVIGLVAGRLVLSIGFPRLLLRFLGSAATGHLRGLLRPVSVQLFVCALAFFAGQRWQAESWLAFCGNSVVTALAAGALSLFGGLNANQRRGLLIRARELHTHRLMPSPESS